MRTETTETVIYSFNELPEDVQATVMDNWRNADVFPWAEDWRASLDAFADTFGIHGLDWSYGGQGDFIRFDAAWLPACEDWEHSPMTEVRLWKWVHANAAPSEIACPWTGYCADEYLLAPLRAFMTHPSNLTKGDGFYELLEDCLISWLEGVTADIEHWYTVEAIREDIAANDYEFTIDGAIH